MHDEGKEGRERRARGHSVRVAILDLLAKEGDELTAAQIRAELPDGPTLASINYHLRILGESRLVVAEEGCFKLS